MPKFSKPWFRKGRGWYLTLDGQQIPLGKDRGIAFSRYHEIMATPRKRPVVVDSVVGLIDQFLGWVRKHRAADTYIWYQSRLQLFATRYPTMLFRDLRPIQLTQWIDGMEVSSGTKRNYCRSIVRCMNWCEEQGLIDKSPLRHFKKPRGGIREIVITPADFDAIIASIKRQPFRDLVTFAWESGARAKECLAIERRHVDLQNHRIVFPVEEEKMKRAPRIIYLTETAEGIIRRLIAKTPDGKLFRNIDGNPWTTEAVNCSFIRVQKKLKKKYCLTAFRHSFAHRMLRSGVDALTVSALLGHADLCPIMKSTSNLESLMGLR